MNIITIIIQILAGCGTFLLGFKVLSENMEKIAGNSLKRLFNKTSDKRLLNVGMGAVATAVVQSSAVTTVMVVGFVNAGIMSLYQAAAMIMGANIGTTLAGQIAALQAFDIDLVFMTLLFIGVAINLFSRSDKVKSFGLAIAGLGLVFVGLGLMSDQMNGLSESKTVVKFLTAMDNPFLLLFIGIALTAFIQSSTAVTTIVISMAGADLLIGGGGNAPLYIILGSNIGTCVTALISSIGTSVNARRASMIHLLFNVIGTVIFTILLLIWKDFSVMTLEKWFTSSSTQIAMFHTFFNATTTLIFLPFTNLLVKLVMLIVPDKRKDEKDSEFTFMDKRFLATPALAINQLTKETMHMADMSMESLQIAFRGFIERDQSAIEGVTACNAKVSSLGEKISDYLVQVSASGIALDDEKVVSALHNNVGDIERISELADNLTKYTKKEVNDNLVFSSVVGEKITALYELLVKQYGLVKKIVLEKDYTIIPESDRVEDEVDNMRRDLISDHIARLSRGECRPENNAVFINLVSNLERIGDHLNYVAHSMDNV